MNYSQNESESQSRTRTGFRGTEYEDEAATLGFRSGKNLTDFGKRLMDPQTYRMLGEQYLPGGKYGLGSNADKAVGEYGNMMFGKASANSAFQGQVTPENMSSVIGSAITNSLPYLIPQIQQYQLAQYRAPQDMFSMAKQVADYWSRSLGAESDSSSSGSGFGFGIYSSGGGTSGSTQTPPPVA